jgi:hypothetical protein
MLGKKAKKNGLHKIFRKNFVHTTAIIINIGRG